MAEPHVRAATNLVRKLHADGFEPVRLTQHEGHTHVLMRSKKTRESASISVAATIMQLLLD